jgi:hypothetical protein
MHRAMSHNIHCNMHLNMPNHPVISQYSTAFHAFTHLLTATHCYSLTYAPIHSRIFIVNSQNVRSSRRRPHQLRHLGLEYG